MIYVLYIFIYILYWCTGWLRQVVLGCPQPIVLEKTAASIYNQFDKPKQNTKKWQYVGGLR